MPVATSNFWIRFGRAARAVFVIVFLAVWGIGWTFGTVALDAMVVHTLSRQVPAAFYPSTTGIVTRIDPGPHASGSGRTVLSPRVTFTFDVAGWHYEGRRGRFDSDFVPDEWAVAHPVGSEVRVYYDPRDPADAGLEPGLNVFDLAFPLVATVFTVVAIGFWSAVVIVLLASVFTALRKVHAPPLVGGMLARLLIATVRPFRMRWILLALACIPATMLVLGVVAGRGTLRVLPLAAWALILWWLVRRATRMRPARTALSSGSNG